MDDFVPVQLKLEFPPNFGKIFNNFEATLPSLQTENDHLQAAAKTTVEFMLQPNRNRIKAYRERFRNHIRQAHSEQPLVSSALLGRFALEKITYGQVWPKVVGQEEVEHVNRLLSSDYVVLN